MIGAIVPYFLCFIVGLIFGKFVKWLDWQGTKHTQIQVNTDGANQVQIGSMNTVKLPGSSQQDD